MIWLKDSIDGWKEAMMVKDVNSLKSSKPSLSEGSFFACSNTVSRIVLVTDLVSIV